MPDHIRKQVRDAAKTDLTGLPTTGAKVFSARVSPIEAAEMPCLNLFILDERSSWDSVPNVARTGDLVVEGRAHGGDDLFDILDLIAAEVESRIYGPLSTLDHLLMEVGTPTTQMEVLDAAQGASRRTGVIRILFPVTYRTALTDPTTKS